MFTLLELNGKCNFVISVDCQVTVLSPLWILSKETRRKFVPFYLPVIVVVPETKVKTYY